MLGEKSQRPPAVNGRAGRDGGCAALIQKLVWRYVVCAMRSLLPMTAMGLVSRVSPVQTAVRNCTRNEGGPCEFGDQAANPKPPQAAVAKSHRDEHCGNAGTMIPAGTVERTSPTLLRLLRSGVDAVDGSSSGT